MSVFKVKTPIRLWHVVNRGDAGGITRLGSYNKEWKADIVVFLMNLVKRIFE